MVYRVKTSKGYWEERESYRDAITGKPRSRFLRYLGRIADDPQARMAQMLDTAERKAQEIDVMQREKFGETGAERAERLAADALFSQNRFLEDTASLGTAVEPSDIAQAAVGSTDAPASNDASSGEVEADGPEVADDAAK